MQYMHLQGIGRVPAKPAHAPMNRDRRNQLSDIAQRLRQIETELEALRDEEQDYLDAMPESIAMGQKGDAATDAIEAMDSAINGVGEAADHIENMP